MSSVSLILRFPGAIPFEAVREAVLARAREDGATRKGNARNWAGCDDVRLVAGDGAHIEFTMTALAVEAKAMGPALAMRSFGEREWREGGPVHYANARADVFRRVDVMELNDRRDAVFELIEGEAARLMAEVRVAVTPPTRRVRCPWCRLVDEADAPPRLPPRDPGDLALAVLDAVDLEGFCGAWFPACRRCGRAKTGSSDRFRLGEMVQSLEDLRARHRGACNDLAALEGRLLGDARERFSRPVLSWVVLYVAPG